MNFVTLLYPPAEVVTRLDEVLAPVRADRPDLRWSDPARWHVTLCFHGRDDPGGLPDFSDLVPPTIRLGDSGTFPRVLWMDVHGPLRPLAERAGAPEDWRPHLTVARGAGDAPWPHLPFDGPEWTVDEIVLVRTGTPTGYETVVRVPLSTPND
ncbi:RNA 2',3'-cyclic phosphodiesterase [Saccharothrix violaceirubra]|uniref:2'-5' RNA ligase n=1 Tax=Saccharothrix violaceirubra TaxID=413306 RepID=A0A7W7SZX1_9PSEU|nr:2'-5' RNA ligase family protein [Saccharothrix violaceirubra]MBB4964048.1 2'-5' RNA ligase [Saccharothrix violaceirubra]